MYYEIDKIDQQILALLMNDAQMAYTDIAKKVGVSSGTVHVRMNKLIDAGIVEGSTLQINYGRLGYDLTAFLGVYLEKSSLYSDVVAHLKQIKEITQIYYTTGTYGIFLKIICRDTAHLREVLHDKIQKINGIERTETFIALEESLHRPLFL